MSRSKKKLWGFISAITLLFVINGALLIGLAVGNRQAKDSNNFTQVKESHVMRWGVRGDTRLFGLINTKTAEPQGFDVDMARAVTSQIAKDQHTKISPKFTIVSANSKIQILKNNGVDAVAATMSITPVRKKVIDLSNPYFPAGSSLLVKRDSNIKNINQLNSPEHTIICVVGSTALTSVEKIAPKAKVVALPDYAQAMSALKAGQGDALSTDNAILFGLAEQNQAYHVVGKPFDDQPYGLAVNKGQTQMMNAVNLAITQIKQNGTYNKLIKKWFSNVPGLDWRTLEQ